MTLRAKRLARLCSLLLALSMLFSLSTVTSAVGAEDTSPTLSVSDSTLTLVDQDQEFTATLTVDASVLNGVEVSEWIAGLTWYLTRDEGFQDPDIYPYYYPGDRLNNWQVWNNGAGGEALFTLGQLSAVQEGNTVTVTQPFTAASFTGINDESSRNRNAWPSFIGPYTLSVRDGDTVIAETDMIVNAYDSYTRYDDVDEAIQEIIDDALPGRYITVTTFGQSEGGRDQYYVTLSDSKESVDAFQEMNAIAETDPASLQAELEAGTMGEYRVPFFLNNVHPDEDPGVDAQLNVLRALATQETITYNTLTGFLDESVDISTMFAPDVIDLGITGLGSQKFTADAEGNIQDNTGVNDASELYDISGDIKLNVDEILDNLIFVICPNENPDGRTYNTRRNDNGFDLNRDASNQTQNETTNLVRVINDWNPVVFAELHGYMTSFLVEPCTPPHEPNLEYDLLVKNFALGAEAFGTAALGTMSATREEHPDTLYWSYYTPLRDAYGLKDDISVSLMSRFQDVFLVEKTQEDLEAVSADICSVLELALRDFDAMRLREGEKLGQDVLSRAASIEGLVSKVEVRSPGIVADYRARLTAKMTEVLQNTQLDESRILTEAAIYADKVAVDEETVRLRSHLSQLRHLLQQEGAIGRKLDFLIQEFNREANTIGSKCNDIETAGYVVDIKAEIEKIREQIQNME